MRTKALVHCMVGIACLLVVAERLRADEATGFVTNSSRGAFQLEEKGAVRQFNLSRAKSVYEPSTWVPDAGDKVKVTFFQNAKNVLVVQKVELVKIGPNNTPPITSPLTVEIIETGKRGWLAKVPSGHTVNFESSRKTVIAPVGMVLMPGQKVRIEFHPEKAMFSFDINFVVDKIEKIDK